jgi:hypothetical protein
MFLVSRVVLLCARLVVSQTRARHVKHRFVSIEPPLREEDPLAMKETSLLATIMTLLGLRGWFVRESHVLDLLQEVPLEELEEVRVALLLQAVR